ncbi:hypothetical protein R3P38DRAFT_2995849 [Favolaschia claudopus]|uniref:Uncharacterized protein n=1 Tax=Favolaschia claudopus TaxID=2862362 RepID=A0AAW0ARQ7_9AGAR
MANHGVPCSKRLGLRFDVPKFQLIHFVSPRRHAQHYRPTPVRIDGTIIEPSTTVKLLGTPGLQAEFQRAR